MLLTPKKLAWVPQQWWLHPHRHVFCYYVV